MPAYVHHIDIFSKEGVGYLELELEVVVSCYVVLEAELGSSGRAASILNYRVISPPSTLNFLL